MTITLLGPQRQRRSLDNKLASLGGGTLSVISAGWQDEEGELDELAGSDYHGSLTELALHRRAEAVFDADPELFQAHRERQTQLKELQHYYRLRLGHALTALAEVQAVALDAPRPARWRRSQRRAALAAVRLLDRQHLRSIRRAHAAFASRWSLAQRPSRALAAEHQTLAALISNSRAVLIAGGHIGALIARLRLFELRPLLAQKPLIAWSAGAMALTETIVAFHDRPPQGPSHAEIIDLGLGLAPGLVLFPHAAERLRLDDRQRVATLAGRFAPLRCVTLETGTELVIDNGQLDSALGSRQMNRSGRLVSIGAA